MTAQLAQSLRTHKLLLALYGLTGLTSVAYEVLWARMLSLQFGVSVFAVVLTVAAFMAGLGWGSLYVASRVARISNPLRLLAVLEGGIALYALCLPWLLHAMSDAVASWAAHLPLLAWYGLMAIAALCLLLIPAFAMGAGLPLILSGLHDTPLRLALAYGWNTLGAAVGALLPLWLLPALGWASAVRVVAGLGLLVAVALFHVARDYAANTTPHAVLGTKPRWPLRYAYAGIGAASLALEMAWTRLFGMVMLRTEYVLALILMGFLLGIALGSLFAPRLQRQSWFAILPIVAGGFSLLTLWMLPWLSAWLERSEFTSLFSAMALQGLLLTLLILPTTLCLGAWLPLLNSRLNGGGVWLYGTNALGGAAGALGAGLVLIPLLGSAATVVVAALALLAIGLAWARATYAWLAIPLFCAAAWPVMYLPAVNVLLPQAQAGSRDLYLYEDAVAMTQVVEQADGQRLLLTDMQRMDASTEPTAVLVQSNQARLPLLLHAQPRSVLFLGLGTGISVAGSLPFPDLRREAVELSRGAIISAQRWFAPVNHDVLNQTTVVHDDVRHFLIATQDKYDVIIGDVFHPDMAGTSALLSVQEFQRARARLQDDGLFVQWLALNQFDEESLAVVLRSFRLVFPEAQLFMDGLHLALVGPRQKFAGAAAIWRNLARLSPAQRDAATGGEGGWTWLGRYWGPVPVTSGAIQDEWAPLIEFRLPRARYSGSLDVTSSLRALLQARPDMQTAMNMLGVQASDSEDFERAYVASELMVRSWLAADQGATQQAGHLIVSASQANAKDHWIAYALADSMLYSMAQAQARGLSENEALQRILHVNPQHVEALRALWHLQRKTGDAQAATTRMRLLELSPLDREARMAGNK